MVHVPPNVTRAADDTYTPALDDTPAVPNSMFRVETTADAETLRHMLGAASVNQRNVTFAALIDSADPLAGAILTAAGFAEFPAIISCPASCNALTVTGVGYVPSASCNVCTNPFGFVA
jgi:hypothetical protein